MPIVETSSNDFYGSINSSGYLTPLQRKKLREIRNDILPAHTPNSRKIPRKQKSLSVKKSKEKTKKLEKKIEHNFQKKVGVLQYSISDVLASREDVENKKFFKNRSPDHFKKAKFSIPLKYKRNLLSFRSTKPLETSTTNTNNAQENSMNVDPIENDNTKIWDCNSPQSSSPCDIGDSADKENNSSLLEISEMGLKEKGIFDFDWPSDQELLEREQKARSSYKAATLSEPSTSFSASDESSLSTLSEASSRSTPPKLYPLFYRTSTKRKREAEESSTTKNSPPRRSIKDATRDDQYILDAGQKEIGAVMCKTCHMLYTTKEMEDEKIHFKYHNLYLSNLRFPGWKNENVVGEYPDGRILLVREGDKTTQMKKIEDILYIANRDLGISQQEMRLVRPNVTFLLFISNDKRVGGCLVAESITSACPVVLGKEPVHNQVSGEKATWKSENWFASSETAPAICGINRIWVALEFRRQKVATRLLDRLRQIFIYGHIVDKNELAFTDPTPLGREFAAFYTGTVNFLVYK